MSASPVPTPVAAPAPSAASKAKSKKRKAQGDSQAIQNPTKKAKASKHDQDDSLLDLEAGVNTAVTRMDPQLMADHVARQTKRFGTDLSPVELSDLYISANAIRDTTEFTKIRTKENLADFLEEFAAADGQEGKEKEKEVKRLGDAPPKNGAPHTIIVTGGGLRAADLVRASRKFQKKGNVVSKLFAKHFKVEEQVKFLAKCKTGIAIGTPARLMDLLDNGALSIEYLKRIVIDASYIDQKKRGLLDMKDTMMPLAKWLSRTEFKERYADDEKHLELLFF
ncbi:Protein cms1 [Cytospora mali]|uniref:Protein cms1 n=1 Tax=Cytospora mali TaxID=578113 RepID=A0A194VFG1_CYTMA|nr:Protein cms1 [Valsa mali var. pyri (nom. inval.)]